MYGKFVLVAASVFSIAAAQSASICSQATATINSQADATQFASCSTISGSVVLGSTASGVISLDGPSTITGDLTLNNASGLTSFSSNSIGQIKGTFSLTDLQLLSTIQMTDLTAVKAILFQGLPSLSSLTFPSTVSKASSLIISNTFLNNLNGINLATVATLQIDNNVHLTDFSTQIGNITNSGEIFANGQGLVVTFPNLIWAANLTFRDVANVSIPSLSVVNGSLGFYESSLDTIGAPNLTAVGNTATGQGSLAFVDDTSLMNISFPLLAKVGGALQIANNTLLGAISFPSLTTVVGAIDFSGNFSSPDMPKLNNVRGGFNVQSVQDISAGCKVYQAESGIGKAIQGKFVCRQETTPSSLGTATTTGTGGSASSTSSKGAAVSYGINEAAAGLSVIGGLLQMLL